MGAPGLTSPIRPEGFAKLQLNAGVFLKNFPVERFPSAEAVKAAVAAEIEDGSLLLGMTSGGGTFTLAREMRLPEVDGRRYPHKGAHFVDSMDGYLTSTLLETTYGNLEALLGKNIPATGDPSTVYRIHTAVDVDDDYLTNIVWIGDLADGKFVAIVIDNAMNTTDFSWTFADKNEGKLPFEFHSHQSNVNLYDVAPVRMIFFDHGDEILYYQKTFRSSSSGAQFAYTHFDNNDLPEGDYIVTFFEPSLYTQMTHGGNASYKMIALIRGAYSDVEYSITTDNYLGGDAFAVPITIEHPCNQIKFEATGSYQVNNPAPDLGNGSIGIGGYSMIGANIKPENLFITAAPATEEAEEEGD